MNQTQEKSPDLRFPKRADTARMCEPQSRRARLGAIRVDQQRQHQVGIIANGMSFD